MGLDISVYKPEALGERNPQDVEDYLLIEILKI
jgi:hypothetical protein